MTGTPDYREQARALCYGDGPVSCQHAKTGFACDECVAALASRIAEEERREPVELLREVDKATRSFFICPICRHPDLEHSRDCRVAAALARGARHPGSDEP